jgi:hypothetical protein
LAYIPKLHSLPSWPGLLLTQNPSQLSCGVVIVNSRTYFCFGDCHNQHQQGQGVCHTVVFAIDIKKYLKAKEEEIMETQIFDHAKI